MTQERQDRGVEPAGDRLSRLSEASLRINETLDFDSVLQEVVDSARALTGARYGALTVFSEAGPPPYFFVSAITPEEHRALWDWPDAPRYFEYLTNLEAPLRVADMSSALGAPEFLPPVGMASLLVAPIRQGGVGVGTIYLSKGEDGREFTREDEETLVLFASQAALVIANAHRYREEQRARTRLETLIDTSPVGVAVFDARTGAPLSFNREAVRIVEGLLDPDQPPEQLLEVMSYRLADGRRIAPFDFAKELVGGDTVRAEEIVASLPDGRSVTVLVNATPLRSEDGAEVETMVVTLQDMTSLHELEKLRAEFLGMVSHELRAPLTSIKGSADTLLESFNALDAAEVVQFIRIIKSQTDRMRDLIGELLDVARIETGTLSVTPEPVALGDLVDEARSTFLTGGGRRNFTIDMELDLPWVVADRRRIVQVLSNLLSNAARYSPDSSAIRVKAALEDDFVEVSVADEGQGVSPEEMPLLFRKFSRTLGQSGAREAPDTGLGLAICKGIVEAHGGRIWAESEGVGLGATFTFTLPVAGVGGAAVERPSSNARSQRGDQARILAVDDDPMVLRYVRDALSRAGYTPVVTTDPDEALRIVERDRPQLVLLDLLLPGNDGIELMGNILDIAEVPVIFLSAYGRDEIIARAFEAGATDYMVKPFSPTELVARVRGALRRRLATVAGEPPAPFVLGDLIIDYAERRVSVAGHAVHLTPTEYELLVELSANAGRVLTFDCLLDRVWGLEHTGDRGSVRTYVKRLRGKLGDVADSPNYILAEPRVGYRMLKEERPPGEPPIEV